MSIVNFLKEIEHLCLDKKMNYIDAVIHWCDHNNVEIDIIANYIKKDMVLKNKIMVEAENLNILKKGARLPI